MTGYSLELHKFEHPRLKHTVFSLIDPVSGIPVKVINDYTLQLSKSVAYNTLESHVFAIKKFSEYLAAALSCVHLICDYENQPAIITIISEYYLYLYAPRSTSNEFYKAVRQLTNHDSISKSSIEIAYSHLHAFFSASHAVDMIVDDLWKPEFTKLNGFDLHESLKKTFKITHNQRVRFKAETVLGAVVRGNNKEKSIVKYFILPKSFRGSGNAGKQRFKAFPFNRFIELLKLSNLREKLLYVILGGTGIRTHEGLQIRLDDFDTDGNLLIRDFNDRKHMDEMDEVQLSEMYASKGRCIENVYWIPGYEQIFRELLKLYLPMRDSCIRKGGGIDHGFLFVTSDSKPGRPLYETQRSSHIKIFRNLSEALNIFDLGKHSLRHMYGVFMLNFMPTKTGKGLSLQLVSKLMGHATLKATAVYAVYEKTELERLLIEAHALMHSNEEEFDIKKLV